VYAWLNAHLSLVAEVAIGCSVVVWVGAKLWGRRMTYDDMTEDYGLFGVVGEMGSGKTYFLVWMAIRALKAGRPVFANFGIEGLTGTVSSWEELLSVPNGSLVLLSEMHLLWPLSKTAKIPQGVQTWVTQLRKRTITCIWDSQYWTQVGLMWRKLTFRVWHAEKMFRAHRYLMFDQFSYAKRGKMGKPLAKHIVKRRADVERAYDTKQVVEGFGAWWDVAGGRRVVSPIPTVCTACGVVGSVVPQRDYLSASLSSRR
jgi:hypothetical protein